MAKDGLESLFWDFWSSGWRFKEINSEYLLEEPMLKLKLQYLVTWCEELTHWKRPWCWEGLKAEGEGGNRGWHGWMISLTQWTRVWANSRRQWRTEEPAALQSMGCKELDMTERLKNRRHSILYVDYSMYTIHTIVSTQKSFISVPLNIITFEQHKIQPEERWTTHSPGSKWQSSRSKCTDTSRSKQVPNQGEK